MLQPLAAQHAAALRAIATKPEVVEWWGPPDDEFPLGDDDEATRFVVRVDAEIVGMVQFAEETEPDYRHASIDVFVDPQWHGRGLGTDALRTLVRYLLDERNHHRITIDPAAENAAAVRCYEKAGFGPVGVMRSAWRDPHGEWRDVLLMELVRLPAQAP